MTGKGRLRRFDRVRTNDRKRRGGDAPRSDGEGPSPALSVYRQRRSADRARNAPKIMQGRISRLSSNPFNLHP
jgi:hypothetical protein